MSDEIRAVLEELDQIHLFTIMDALEIDAAYEDSREILTQLIIDHSEDHGLDIDDIRDAISEAVRTVRVEYDDNIEDLSDEVMEELHPHF